MTDYIITDSHAIVNKIAAKFYYRQKLAVFCIYATWYSSQSQVRFGTKIHSMRILAWYRLTLGVLWVVTPARVLVLKQVGASRKDNILEQVEMLFQVCYNKLTSLLNMAHEGWI